MGDPNELIQKKYQKGDAHGTANFDSTEFDQ
jgi:hypothetical protein